LSWKEEEEEEEEEEGGLTFPASTSQPNPTQLLPTSHSTCFDVYVTKEVLRLMTFHVFAK